MHKTTTLSIKISSVRKAKEKLKTNRKYINKHYTCTKQPNTEREKTTIRQGPVFRKRTKSTGLLET